MIRVVIALIVLLAIGIGGWLVFRPGVFSFGSTISPRLVGAAAAIESDYVVPPMEGNYRNNEFRFSLQTPEGFHASELPADEHGAKTILLQDEKGNGIQIYVTPNVGAARTLAAADVRASISDMQVSNEQEVEIGDDYRGVAFMSDSADFGGASREVWFYFRGNLYQISTYARLDNLLQSMFGTWQFF